MSGRAPTTMDERVVHLSVVIPAFEEAERLGPTLAQVRAYLEHQSFESEVLVVVDGGRDGTLEMTRRVADGWPALRVFDNGVNHGKGYSVRRGMLEARGRYLLFSDADLSTPIADVERLIAALDGGADVAIGSRSLAGSDVRTRQVWWRQSMGRVFNWVVRLVAVGGFQDTQCGFKMFRGDVAEDLFGKQRTTGWGFDVEILYIARKRGLRILEMPIDWYHEPSSKINPVGDSIQMVKDVVLARWRGIIGTYR